jgi:RNA polymerase sigma-70 factor (ECF subfamily)
MNGPPDEDLARHARALRGLARALVGAEHADDVAQDAAVEALRQPPGKGFSLLGWLAGIVRNRARRHHRDAKRRAAREHRAASATPTVESATPLDAAVHREMVARLDAALLGLPQPYQDTLLWRYYEGLTPAEIAARSGTPVATVKSRLQRALAMVRERLDDDQGGGGWRKALGPAFGLGENSAVAAAAALTGITLMLGKMVLGALAAVCVGVWLWPDGDLPSAAETAVVRNDVATSSAASGPGTTLAEPAAQREAAPPPTGEQTTAGATPAAVTLTGRCVDEAGTPLAGVQVVGEALRGIGDSTLCKRTIESGSDGSFAISLPPLADGYLSLSLQAPDRCEARGSLRDAVAGERRDLGDLVLEVAHRVRGRVVDTSGAPQQDVSVLVHRQLVEPERKIVSTWVSALSRATSDALGEFVVTTPLPAGRYWLKLDNRALVGQMAFGFALGGNPRERTLELVVQPAPPACRGIVVSNSGAPIANAEVSLDDNWVRTDVEGRFTVLPRPPYRTAERRILVFAAGYLDRVDHVWRPGDTRVQRIELRPEPSLVLRVVDGVTGAPLEQYETWVVAADDWADPIREPKAPHAGGVSRRQVAPGHWFLVVTPAGSAHSRTPFVPFEMPPDRDVELTVRAWPEQSRRLVVTDGQHPIAGVDVELLDPGDLEVRCDTETQTFETCRMSGSKMARIVQKGTTAADGALVLHGPKGDLALRLSGGGLALQIVQPIRLDEASDLLVTAQRGARLRGRLVPIDVARHVFAASRVGPNAAPPPVGIRLVSALDGYASLHRRMEPPFPIDPEGAFDIGGVPAGKWHVVVVKDRHTYAATTVDVPVGGDVERTIDVAAITPAFVTLRLLVDGAPAKDAFVNAMGWHAADSFGQPFRTQTVGRTDEQGAMRIETLVGELVLVVSAATATGSGPRLTTILQVPRTGEQEHLVDLRAGGLDVTLLRPDGSPAAGVSLRMSGSHGSCTWSADASGRVQSDGVAAGPLALEALPRSLTSDAARTAHTQANGWQALEREWMPIGTLTVTPGAAVPQRVVLPSVWDR